MPSPHVTLKPDDIEYDIKVVAFLDVLGFRNLIRAAKEATQAADIICSLDRALRHARPTEARPFGTVKMFSDCICVSGSPTAAGLDFVLWRCVVMQGLILERGHLLRGAVTYGRHYESESMIFSAGLVDSYELEHSAIYPRVIVSAEVAKGATETARADRLWSPANDLILEDQDGMLFLDYFHYMELLSYIHAWKPAPYESTDISLTPTKRR